MKDSLPFIWGTSGEDSSCPSLLRRLSLPVLAIFMLAGCGQAVREDRSILFTSDGKQVAFQHGRDGIFVAETEGAAPTKIFEPDADVIAVGTPLWSPVDKRLLFTTARPADNAHQGGLPAEQDPAGNLHYEGPTLYTCWLRTEPKPGQPLNVPLFTVRCGHPGYVAANLAVRWHPDGQHILFVKQDDAGRHGLFEYGLQSKSSRQVFPHTGDSLLFDWAPDNAHLVCVLGEGSGASPDSGIWIGKPGEDDWWHVPDSSDLGQTGLTELRATRPVWTNDGSRFAFVSSREKMGDRPAVHSLHLGVLDTRTVQTLTSGDKPIRDLHWRPDGSRLGYLCGGETAVFHLANPATKKDRIIGDAEMCNFLGWDAGGEQLAFVARQPLPHDPAKSWAFLFLPDVRARNTVMVAPDADPAQRRIVFSGLQVTFPHWSPKEAKLSLWATFRPPYRSWLSHLLELGADSSDPLRGLTLRPGDPALVLDPATGERSWKAIDAHEKTQVGHYHLMRREYDEAWRWYIKAAGERRMRRIVHLNSSSGALPRAVMPCSFTHIVSTNSAAVTRPVPNDSGSSRRSCPTYPIRRRHRLPASLPRSAPRTSSRRKSNCGTGIICTSPRCSSVSTPRATASVSSAMPSAPPLPTPTV